MSEMLFDTSPDEVEGRKKSRKRPSQRPQAGPTTQAPDLELPSEARYLASIDGHYQCDCGMTLLDLAEERWVNGKKQWLVQCGWWCGMSWLVDPVPGILDKEDAKQRVSGKAFVVKGGRFDGKTFDEIDAMGCRNHIVGLAEKGREYLAAAAREWLSRNGG